MHAWRSMWCMLQSLARPQSCTFSRSGWCVVVLQGLGGFYKGMRVKLLQTVLAAALLMMLKEELFTATRQLLNMTAPAGSRRRIQRR